MNHQSLNRLPSNGSQSLPHSRFNTFSEGQRQPRFSSSYSWDDRIRQFRRDEEDRLDAQWKDDKYFLRNMFFVIMAGFVALGVIGSSRRTAHRTNTVISSTTENTSPEVIFSTAPPPNHGTLSAR